MKFRFLICLMFLFISNGTFAQNPTLDYRFKEIDIDDNNEYQSILGKWNGNLIAVRSRNDKVGIQRRSQSSLMKNDAIVNLDIFDQNLNLNKSFNLLGFTLNSTEEDAKNIEFLKLDSVNSKVFIGYTTFKKPNFNFFLVELDLNLLEFYNDRIVYSDSKFDRRGSFYFTESINGRFFGVYSFLPDPNENKSSTFLSIIFDSKFQMVHHNFISLPYGEKGSGAIIDFNKYSSLVKGQKPLINLKNNIVYLENSGILNLVLRISYLDRRKDNLKPHYYHLIRVRKEEGMYDESILGMSDSSYMEDIYLHEDNNGNLVVVGRWIEPPYYGRNSLTKGIAIYYVNVKNFGDPSYKFIEFKEEQIKQLLTKKGQYLADEGYFYKKSEMPEALPFLHIENSIIKKNGSFDLFLSSGKTIEVDFGTHYFGGDLFNLEIINEEIRLTTISRNYSGRSLFQPFGPVYMNFANKSGVLFLDSNNYEIKVSTIDKNKEVSYWDVLGVKESDEFKNSIIKYFQPIDELKYYVILKKIKGTKFIFYLVEIDLPFDKI